MLDVRLLSPRALGSTTSPYGFAGATFDQEHAQESQWTAMESVRVEERLHGGDLAANGRTRREQSRSPERDDESGSEATQAARAGER